LDGIRRQWVWCTLYFIGELMTYGLEKGKRDIWYLHVDIKKSPKLLAQHMCSHVPKVGI